MPKVDAPRRLSLTTHIADWTGCRRCPLALTRRNVVIGRGQLPCDALFVGEAPGESEDVCGSPFVENAPAGGLLKRIVERALSPWSSPLLRTAYTNVVGCVPKDEYGNKVGEPEYDSCVACRPRLQEFLDMAQPRLIVAVGRVAGDWLGNVGMQGAIRRPVGCEVVHIPHPANLLRAKDVAPSQYRIGVQNCVVAIRRACLKVFSTSEAKY